MDASSIIALVLSLYVCLKAFVEWKLTKRQYAAIEPAECVEPRDELKEECDELLHVNQHLAILMGIIMMTGMISFLVLVGITFSAEWIPVYWVVCMIWMYALEHFEQERKGVIKPIHPIKDLFSIEIKEYLWPKKPVSKLKGLHDNEKHKNE